MLIANAFEKSPRVRLLDSGDFAFLQGALHSTGLSPTQKAPANGRGFGLVGKN